MRFTVPGPPVPWQRARSNGKRRFTAPKVAAHAELIRTAWMAAGRPRFEPGQPLALHVACYMSRPKDHYRTGRHAHLLRDSAAAIPASRPDVDNYGKIVLDALSGPGLAWADDGQVADLYVQKRYGEPRTEIGARRLTEPSA